MTCTSRAYGTFALLLIVVSSAVHFQQSLPGCLETTLWMLIGCEQVKRRAKLLSHAASLQRPLHHHRSCGYIPAFNKITELYNKLLHLTRPDTSSIASQWTIHQARRDLKNTRTAWALRSAKKAEHAKDRHRQATQTGDQQALRGLRGQVVTLGELARKVTHFM